MKTLRFFLFLILPLASFAGDLPEEARKLADDHAKEMHRLNLAYTQKLDALLVNYRAAGDTEKAAAIQALIDHAEGRKTTANSEVSPLVGTWKRDLDGSIWRFAEDGTGSYNGKEKMKVTYDPGRKRFAAVSDRWVNHVMVTPNPDVLNGVYEKAGKTLRFKLTRVK